MSDEKESEKALKEFGKMINEYNQSHETIQSNLEEIETIKRQVSCRFDDYLGENYLKNDSSSGESFKVNITSAGLVIEYVMKSNEFDFNKIKDLFDIMGLPRIDVRMGDKKLIWIIKGDS